MSPTRHARFHIKDLDQEKIKKLISTGSLEYTADGKMISISKEDVEIKKAEIPGASVMLEGDFGVGIDTNITPNLEYEGMVRELIHKAQLLRKEANFNLVDRIKIFYETDEKLHDAIQQNLDYLKNETLAVEVHEGIQPADIQKDLDVNGIQVKISLQRI